MKFEKKLFVKDGPYCMYPVNGKLTFVARFKHVPTRRTKFVAFLIKNFTVEEYFDALAFGESPLGAAMQKGFQV